MPRERASHSAHRLDSGGREEPPLAIARFPDVSEEELQEGQTALRGGGRGGQLADEGVGFEAYSLYVCRPGDRLAKLVVGEAPQKIERPRDQLAQARQRGERPEEVVASRGQDADPVVAGGQLRERGRDFRGFRAAERDQLLELVHEHHHSLLSREIAAQLAREARGVLAKLLLGRCGVLRRKRAREGGEWTAAGNDPRDVPGAAGKRTVVHGGHDAREAERRLSPPRVAGDEHEGIGPHPLDEREAIAVPPEEEGAVLGLERQKAAIRIPLGNRKPASGA